MNLNHNIEGLYIAELESKLAESQLQLAELKKEIIVGLENGLESYDVYEFEWSPLLDWMTDMLEKMKKMEVNNDGS